MEPPLGKFARSLLDMLDATAACILARQHMPAAVLMYTLIDAVAWAAHERSIRSVRIRFEGWTNRWLIPPLEASCHSIRAVDLYGARCAILHTLTPNSDLTATGEARQIAYVWGAGTAEALRAVAGQMPETASVIVLHFSALESALRTAILQFFDDAECDSNLQRLIIEAAASHFSVLGPVPADAMCLLESRSFRSGADLFLAGTSAYRETVLQP